MNLDVVASHPLLFRPQRRTERGAESHTGVAILVDAHVQAEMKVLVIVALRIEMTDAGPGVDKDAVNHAPVARLAGMCLPPAQVLAVEERDEAGLRLWLHWARLFFPQRDLRPRVVADIERELAKDFITTLYDQL